MLRYKLTSAIGELVAEVIYLRYLVKSQDNDI